MEYLGPHDHPSVVKLLGSFEVTGPNGVHACLVLPVCGPSLYSWSLGRYMFSWTSLCKTISVESFTRTFTPGARHRIAQQVANGVAFLHEPGIVHAGSCWAARDIALALASR